MLKYIKQNNLFCITTADFVKHQYKNHKWTLEPYGNATEKLEGGRVFKAIQTNLTASNEKERKLKVTQKHRDQHVKNDRSLPNNLKYRKQILLLKQLISNIDLYNTNKTSRSALTPCTQHLHSHLQGKGGQFRNSSETV